MRRAATRWTLASAGSLVAHLGLAALVIQAIAPDDEPRDSRPEASITIETHRVDRTEARAGDAAGEAADEAQPDASGMSQASIPVSRARGAEVPTQRAPTAAPALDGLPPAEPPVESLQDVAPDAESAGGAALGARRLAAAAPVADSVGAETPGAAAAAERAPLSRAAAGLAPAGQSVAELTAPIDPALQSALPRETELAARPGGARLSAEPAAGPRADAVAPASGAAPEATSEGPRVAALSADVHSAAPLDAPAEPASTSTPDGEARTAEAPRSEAAAGQAPSAEELPVSAAAGMRLAVEAAAGQRARPGAPETRPAAALAAATEVTEARNPDAQSVEQTAPRGPELAAGAPHAEAAAGRAPVGEELAGATAPTERIGVGRATGSPATTPALDRETAVALAPERKIAEASDPDAPTAVQAAAGGRATAALAPASEPVVPAVPTGQSVVVDAAPSDTALTPGSADGPPAETQAPEAEQAAATAPDAPPAEAGRLPQEARGPARFDAAALTSSPTTSDAVAPAVAPPAAIVSATLAWTGGAEADVDPVSLEAIQSFMQEGDIDDAGAGEVRDALSGVLAAVPCARLQTAFVPETGQLEVRGHVPEGALRAPVLAALRSRVGGAIPVADNMLVLPRPQCSTLSGIAATGLPQSTDQLTNPRIIGPDAHARVYDFAAGERLVFDLTGPDYRAYIYADYYDADGMVIHLRPNEFVPLRRVGAAEEIEIGSAAAGGLELTVAPPFGQEIVVAMATTQPIYDGARPIREPAAPYLDFLRNRIAALRQAEPSFKGEWVYFFVRTHAG